MPAPINAHRGAGLESDFRNPLVARESPVRNPPATSDRWMPSRIKRGGVDEKYVNEFNILIEVRYYTTEPVDSRLKCSLLDSQVH
jgi:hypothetical protein